MPVKTNCRDQKALDAQKRCRKRQKRSASAKACQLILQRPLAPVERLPTGILEHIFNLACDLSLPKASWHLMKKLDRHPIYKTMIAFASVTLAGPKASTFSAPCNVVLAGLPPLSSHKRVRLRKETICSEWLTPDFVRKLQLYFVNEVVRARWAMLCLEKSYGSFKVRSGQKYLWRETMAAEPPARITMAATHFEIFHEK